MNATRDRTYLAQAVELALAAASSGEYPIGVVLVGDDGTVLGTAINQSLTTDSRIQHAEMRVLAQIPPRSTAVEVPRMTIYTSLEPCLMCFGAAVVSRIKRIVWACGDPYGGAARALVDRWPLPHLPIPETVAEPYPDLREASRDALVAFFAKNNREDILRVWHDAGYSR